ncbi:MULTISPECIES: PepSY domain-containing protein [unclassified Neptuniibacter]|uniref:PepSY domain-containing protein n=1 Tax=unclassified Neptuniibacter TaxID=2630693 RepID=UPI000C6622CC|nr:MULTISPECIES: PepSY domain-containing protein [unclassified Neptuniibacter]MAY42047.1 hypothetical protein [Oceanospirillaceae bacterium]|tara:strand:+ start:19974 stop:20354 length:381 start_codon:yes stop_codon:yes gene_type:complete
MNKKILTIFITSCVLTGAAFASEDCTDPVSDWQPRQHLRQMVTDRGWQVDRIKVDDGCYEVKGLDRKGNRIEAKFSPASFSLIELEIEFDESGDASDYLKGWDGVTKTDGMNPKAHRSNKPKVTIE